jgi:hypothetical protein
MKVISILITALVANTQCSFTWAQGFPSALANSDKATTPQGVAVNIDVLANDFYDVGLRTEGDDDAAVSTPFPSLRPSASPTESATSFSPTASPTESASTLSPTASPTESASTLSPTESASTLSPTASATEGASTLSYSLIAMLVESTTSSTLSPTASPSATNAPFVDRRLIASYEIFARDAGDDDGLGSLIANPMLVPVADLPAAAVFTFTQPVTAQGAVKSVANGKTPTVLFTPADGFTGTATFSYSFTVESTVSTTVDVTVDVTPTVADAVTDTTTPTVAVTPSFLLPSENFVSKEKAQGFVRGNLFDVASVTPTAPDPATLTAVLGFVNDVDINDFTEKLSPEEVNKSLATQLAGFLKLFAGN